MTANAVIGFPRWTGKASFGGGAYRPEHPLANLEIDELARVARSSDATAASSQFVATLDRPRGVRLMALVNHNVSRDGRIRVRLYEDAGLASLVLDTGWLDVWPLVYAWDDLEWEDDNWWDGKYSPDEMAGTTAIRPFFLDRIYSARALRVEIDDSGNPDGYVEFGLFDISQGWQLSVNPDFGGAFGLDDLSQVQQARSGVEYHDAGPKQRRFQGRISYLRTQEALAKGFEAQRQLGTTAPFLWFFRPEAQLHWLRETWMARFAELGLQQYAVHDRNSYPISLKEML